jgi:hypothetical protein
MNADLFLILACWRGLANAGFYSHGLRIVAKKHLVTGRQKRDPGGNPGVNNAECLT